MEFRAPCQFAQPCADKLLELFMEAKRLATINTLPEIELRFGSVIPGGKRQRVSAGLPAHRLDRVTKAFVESTCWVETQPWQRAHVFHYTLDDGMEYRTETVFHDNNSIESTTLHKQRIMHVDMTTSDIGVRLALATETPVDKTKLPPIVYPKQVFVKHRRTFFFAKEGSKPVWAYTLTLRWAGATLENVYASLMSAEEPPPLVELEIELVDKDYFDAHSAEYLAHSVVAKAHDVLALMDDSLCDPATFQLVPAT